MPSQSSEPQKQFSNKVVVVSSTVEKRPLPGGEHDSKTTHSVPFEPKDVPGIEFPDKWTSLPDDSNKDYSPPDEWYEKIYKWFPENTLSLTQVKQVIDEAWQSAIIGVKNIASWRPFEEEPAIPIHNSMDLDTLKTGLTTDIEQINTLLEEAQKGPKNELTNYRKASALTCKMLQQTLDNGNFRKAVRQLAKARIENEGEFSRVATSLDLLDRFFQKELELLKEQGVPMAEILVNEGRKALADVRAGNAPPTKIYEAIQKLADAACGLEDELGEQITEANRERAKKVIKKAALGVGAVTVAIVNVQAEATLTAPLAALSGHMAAGIIGAAAADLWPS